MKGGFLSGLSTQDSGLIPDWCESGRGAGPILLIAPHGGRRPPVDAAALPPRLRVNDLYTPEVTRTLAARLDAGFIINRALDRNVLDLNRLSQVRRHASWFLDLLVRRIDGILARHACAELIFVHGWNTGQAKCDIGIGATETEAGLHLADGAQLTVSEGYLRTRIAALRAACAHAGIQAPIGERYPASHPNNLLQLFAAREPGDEPVVRRIAEWVTQKRVEALQLELGVPLRWPGSWRERFVAAAVEALGPSRTFNVQASPRPAPSRDSALSTQDSALSAQHSLQFYDPVAGIGLSAGVGRIGPQVTGGRLLLFLGGQRVALFTGEEAHAQGSSVAPLDLTGGVRFAGAMLLLDDGATYLDLEAAFSASRLVDAEVAVRFEPLGAPSLDEDQDSDVTMPSFGRMHGRVRVDRRELRVDATGFANAGGFRAGSHGQTMIAATFGAEHAVLSRAADGAPNAVTLHFTAAARRTLDTACLAISTDGDAYTPASIELTCDGQLPLVATPLTRMAILRPAGRGRYLRVTFGVAACRWGERAGYGLYEHARPVPSRAPAARP